MFPAPFNVQLAVSQENKPVKTVIAKENGVIPSSVTVSRILSKELEAPIIWIV